MAVVVDTCTQAESINACITCKVSFIRYRGWIADRATKTPGESYVSRLNAVASHAGEKREAVTGHPLTARSGT